MAADATILPGSLVIVDTEGGKPGTVKHITPDGWYAVHLLNEGDRWDEWPRGMVRAATPEECVEAAKKFLP